MHFGLETLNIIESQTERLIEVPGIAKASKDDSGSLVSRGYQGGHGILPQGHGVSTTYAVKSTNSTAGSS